MLHIFTNQFAYFYIYKKNYFFLNSLRLSFLLFFVVHRVSISFRDFFFFPFSKKKLLYTVIVSKHIIVKSVEFTTFLNQKVEEKNFSPDRKR